MATIPNSQKTFSVNEGVNTVYGGSASMKALSQWYTMQDITDTVRPYQVYTALLTQNGEDDPSTITTPQLLVIGQTYQISLCGEGDDFTNIGAPSNTQYTWFVATGTTPAVWANGSNLFTNGAAPVATVLENTIGNIWFEYNSVGAYLVKSDNLFIDGKTTFLLSPNGYIESPLDIHSNGIAWAPSFEGMLVISTHYNYEWADSQLNYGGYAFIEIRVYN